MMDGRLPEVGQGMNREEEQRNFMAVKQFCMIL